MAKNGKKPMPKSKMAKDVVLATSESDLSEIEGKKVVPKRPRRPNLKRNLMRSQKSLQNGK